MKTGVTFSTVRRLFVIWPFKSIVLSLQTTFDSLRFASESQWPLLVTHMAKIETIRKVQKERENCEASHTVNCGNVKQAVRHYTIRGQSFHSKNSNPRLNRIWQAMLHHDKPWSRLGTGFSGGPQHIWHSSGRPSRRRKW